MTTWSTTFDFEGLQPGDPLGFVAKSLTTASFDYAHGGTVGCKMTCPGGSDGFHHWGAEALLPPLGKFPTAPQLGQGSEVWNRIWFYFPTGFNFTATGAGLKLTRYRTYASGGAHDGYLTLLIRNGISMISEVGGANFYSTQLTSSLGVMPPTGQWHAIEHYVKLHSTQGIYRVWQNGTMIFNDTSHKTLKTSSSYCGRLYVFTYWNGGAPGTQTAYIDDWTTTTGTPGDVDAHGNPFIGIGDSPPPPEPVRNKRSILNAGENVGENVGEQ